jgi:hypothetical protein
VLDLAVGERTKRLAAMVQTVGPDDPSRIEVRERIADVCALFEVSGNEAAAELPPILAEALAGSEAPYVATIRALPADARAAGVGWLQQVVDDLCGRAAALLPSMDLFAGD